MRILFKYLKVWWLMSKNSFLGVIGQKFGLFVFLTGKILRFGLFVIFLSFLLKGTQSLAGYNGNQIIFFFLTFSLIDVFAQFLFREVYRFRPLVVSGGFDLVLVKPVSSLFRSLMGGADVIDLLTIPPLLIVTIVVGVNLNPSFVSILTYFLLVINGILIAAAFHIVVISLGIITLEVDHTVMIYRDLVSLGRFPIDIYKEPIKGALTYFIPVAIMIAVPAKFLIGLISIKGILFSFAVGIISLAVSLRIWRLALRQYTSASS